MPAPKAPATAVAHTAAPATTTGLCSRVNIAPMVQIPVGKSTVLRPTSPVTRILLGGPKRENPNDARSTDGLPAMALLLGGLLVFSVWLPAPLLEVMHQAASIIGGKR